MKQNLSFYFQYNEDQQCPTSLYVVPNPNTVSEINLVLVINTCIQALAKTHGLEQALTMVTDAACGRLLNGSRFDTHWVNSGDGDEDEDEDEA